MKLDEAVGRLIATCRQVLCPTLDARSVRGSQQLLRFFGNSIRFTSEVRDVSLSLSHWPLRSGVQLRVALWRCLVHHQHTGPSKASTEYSDHSSHRRWSSFFVNSPKFFSKFSFWEGLLEPELFFVRCFHVLIHVFFAFGFSLRGSETSFPVVSMSIR